MLSFRKYRGVAVSKHLLMLPLVVGLLCICSHSFAQSPPPPPTPPPPPDELLKKINPFKKHKKDTSNKKIDTAKVQSTRPGTAPGGPPPPPNPLNLFKKKRDTTKKS